MPITQKKRKKRRMCFPENSIACPGIKEYLEYAAHAARFGDLCKGDPPCLVFAVGEVALHLSVDVIRRPGRGNMDLRCKVARIDGDLHTIKRGTRIHVIGFSPLRRTVRSLAYFR